MSAGYSITLLCTQCVKPFTRESSAVFPGRLCFCSKSCQDTFERIQRAFHRQEFSCTQCQSLFDACIARRKKYAHHFCSHDCYLAYKADLFARFWEKVSLGSFQDCWPWTGCLQSQGYGQINTQKKRVLTHRVAFEMLWGPLAPGRFVLHRCDNPPCCNPWHLFQGDHKDNMQDMMQKGRRGSPVRHYGEEIHNAKLTTEAVLLIRELYATRQRSRRDLSNQFAVTYQQIDHIVKRRQWVHV